MSETQKIQGEVEAWKNFHPFPGKRGSIGLLLSGNWRNLVATEAYIDECKEKFPIGTKIVAVMVRNKKGFWDIRPGSIMVSDPVMDEKIKEEIAEEEVNDEPMVLDRLCVIEAQLNKLIPRVQNLEERFMK